MIAKIWLRDSRVCDGEVEISQGYRRVWKGTAKPGDLHLNSQLYEHDRLVEWLPITEEELSQVPEEERFLLEANAFTLLIRKDDGANPYNGCERCQLHVEMAGCRICRDCRNEIRKEILRIQRGG